MRTEDLFKYGVTPKEGKNAEKRFKVLSIEENGIVVTDWGKETGAKYNLAHGDYDLWHEPKTLFEDSTLKPTWGNLKKAMEAAGLDDDTVFAVPRTDWFVRGYVEPAEFSIETLREPYEKPKKVVVVK